MAVADRKFDPWVSVGMEKLEAVMCLLGGVDASLPQYV